VVFVKSFEKTCFSVRFGSSASSLTSTLNVQKSVKPLIFEYIYGNFLKKPYFCDKVSQNNMKKYL